MSDDRWLLPEGVEEILPNDARRFEAARRQVIDLFERWGYELVMPPMLEYLESLLTGVGKDLDLQTFKLTDQLTGRLMGIRADITPQAARIDAHYLKRGTPARLCYVGAVLRTRPGEFAGSREPLQLGAELFGHAGPQGDLEILRLMLATLDILGIAQPYLDLGHVGVFRALVAQAGLTAAAEDDLFDALQRKARPDVERVLAQSGADAEAKRMLAGLVDLHGDADVLARARDVLRAGGPGVQESLDNLAAIADGLRRFAATQPVHFDLAELHGHRYYTGLVFSVFVPGHGMAVAQGGRYDEIGRAFGRARAAAGFGADLRALLRLAGIQPAVLRGVAAPYADDALLQMKIAELRAAGECVIENLNGPDPRCDRELIKKDGAWVVVKRQ